MPANLPIRTLWRATFPDVVIHTSVKARDGHPCYQRAKSGDAEAAYAPASDLIDDHATEELAAIIDRTECVFLPVVADETSGFNAIPDAMAQILADTLGVTADPGEIVQTNKVGHTRAMAFQRLVTPAEFGGVVRPDRRYILVDDHVGLGGTLTNLKAISKRAAATWSR